MIVHLTSAHRRDDIRVFHKMCRSLAEIGHAVTLVVADGLGDASIDGVHIVDTGRPRSRVDRMVAAAARGARMAASFGADIVHLHDPELIRFASPLARSGAKVVLDAHEDVEKQILSKAYLPAWTRGAVSGTYGLFERSMLKYVDLVIGATPSITAKFRRLRADAVTVNNFPILGELATPDVVWANKEPMACYVGGMSTIRGATPVAAAAALLDAPRVVKVAGGLAPASLQAEMTATAGARLAFQGQLGRKEVGTLMAQACAGIVTFLPVPNHVDAQPNKMFEYMSAGLPVIASDFPLWREIIEGADCGLLVDPADPRAIADAINTLIDNPVRAETLGRNGQRAVRERYNWANEFATLKQAYADLLAR